MTRAAIYVRLSRDTDATTSPERQRADCIALAEQRGWEVAFIEEDIDVSASKQRLDRAGLDRLRARYAEIDVVIFWKVDRLARSLLDFAALMDEAEKAGVALVSVKEPIDMSTPMGRAMAQIVAIFAELEAKTIGMRVASAQEYLVREGRARGGSVVFGYTTVPNPNGPGFIYAPDPDCAPLVKEAAERVLAGESLYSICRDWNARGVPRQRSGKDWSIKVLGAVLRNPTLTGKTVRKGQVLRGDDGLPVVHWTPILDDATQRAVIEEIDARRATPTGHRWDSEHLLAGIVRCAACDRPLYAQTSTDSSGYVRATYQCKAKSSGRGSCPGVSISRANVEDYVVDQFLHRFGRFAVVRVIDSPGQDNRAEIETVQASLTDLEADRYERGLFTGPAGVERFTRLYSQLEARLAALQAAHAPGERRVEETGQTFAEAWESTNAVAERRSLLSSAVEHVAVAKGVAGRRGFDPSRVDIAWRA